LRRVSAHDNVLSYIGLTQEPNADNIVTVVLDYAEDNLRDYLSDNELPWAKKLQLAKQLTGGLYCLHQYDMYHGNLISDNIGMTNGRIKLHNFGRYKKIEESKKTLAQYFEQIPYLDPQHLKNPKKFFRDEIISDIYSLGVLFWEISSQKPPFEEYSNEPCRLCYLIVYENLRE
ncbi:15701_t:CDS:2, partial [Entrophospora sp. SA101]